METLLIVVLAAICTVLPLWMGQRYGLVPLVSPLHLLGYFCFFGFLLKVAVYGFAPDLAFYRGFTDTPWAAQRGAIYLAGFILLMCLGYRCAVRPTRVAVQEARLIASGLQKGWWLFGLAFAVAGLTIVFLLRARGVSVLSLDVLKALNNAKQINVNESGVGATLAGLKSLFIVPKLAFVLLLAQGLVLRQGWIMAQALVLAGLLVVIALISGDRFELVELLVFALATAMILRVGTGARTVLTAALCGAGLLGVSAYMTQLRGQDAGLVHQIVGSTYFLDINAAVMVTGRVTPQTYLLGESYGWWVFGWVPRALWIDKPAIDLGVYFKADVMQVPTGGAFNVTGPGEAFINFGWAGMLVGFALGWVYRKGEAALLAGAHVARHGSIFLYPLLFYPFVQATLQSSFSAFVVGAAAQLVLILVLIAVFVPRYRVIRPMRFKPWGMHHAV